MVFTFEYCLEYYCTWVVGLSISLWNIPVKFFNKQMPALLKFLTWLAYSSASLNFVAESNWKQIVYSCSDCSRKEIRTLHIITTKCINYSFNNILNLVIKHTWNILHFADFFSEHFFHFIICSYCASSFTQSSYSTLKISISRWLAIDLFSSICNFNSQGNDSMHFTACLEGFVKVTGSK